jgi:hypothetical protein
MRFRNILDSESGLPRGFGAYGTDTSKSQLAA